MASKDKTRSNAPQLRPGPNGLPRGQVTEIQRGRMLAATVEAVEEVGYARLTVAQVISRAKVSRKTFYDVFLDREDCFLAALDEAIERIQDLAVQAYDSESSWRESTRAGLTAILAFMQTEPGLARLCIVEALGAGPRVLARRGEILKQLERVVDRGRKAPGAKGVKSSRSTREPADITAEGIVGAVFAVLHTRLLAGGRKPLTELVGPLMSMIVLPYLGARIASNELTRPAPKLPKPSKAAPPIRRDPLEGLDMRLTYRTVRVLTVISENPGASNREVAEGSGIADQGQISKLLTRLERLELVTNTGEGQLKGGSNAWNLTDRGAQVERATRPR
ncbi:MAG TPA: TetR/AcrR family transcriptional regulator [Solirubrobacteraceae bacterium]|jgi:AcrR family transcriptional regulator